MFRHRYIRHDHSLDKILSFNGLIKVVAMILMCLGMNRRTYSFYTM